MDYLVSCSFDLKRASSDDYKNAYFELEKIGLKKVIISDGGGNVVIPTTMVVGKFNGDSAASVRDYIKNLVKNIFKLRNFSSEIFVVVGGDWAWGSENTN